LPETPFLAAALSSFQHQVVALPLAAISVMLPYLLGDLPVVVVIQKFVICLPFYFPVAVTTFLAVHFPPIAGLF